MTVRRVTKWQSRDGQEWPDEPAALRQERALDLVTVCADVYPADPSGLARALVEAERGPLQRFSRAVQDLMR